MKLCLLISLVLTIFITESCANLGDEWIDLGDDYVCKIDADTKAISSRQIYYDTEIHSKILDYKFDDRYIIAKQKPDYKYYKNFIRSNYNTRYLIYGNYLREGNTKGFKSITTPFILKSIIADSTFYKTLKAKGVSNRNQIQDREIIGTVVDSVFKSDPFYKNLFASKENYWIVDKDNNVRFGPFQKNEFEKMCKQKQIILKFT